LEDVESELAETERMLNARYSKLHGEAVERKRMGDIPGAKRKLRESISVRSQLERLNTSMSYVQSNLTAISNSELNNSLLSVLKLSHKAIGNIDVAGKSEEAGEAALAIQECIQTSGELNDMLSMPVGAGSAVSEISEAELMEELSLLGASDDVQLGSPTDLQLPSVPSPQREVVQRYRPGTADRIMDAACG
jgi:hypothetical protein